MLAEADYDSRTEHAQKFECSTAIRKHFTPCLHTGLLG